MLFGYIAISMTLYLELVIFMLFILIILSSFLSLNIGIDEQYLRVKFGYGIFRKKFRLSEIVSVKSVKNY